MLMIHYRNISIPIANIVSYRYLPWFNENQNTLREKSLYKEAFTTKFIEWIENNDKRL